MPTFLKVTVTAVLDPALTSLGIVFETHSTRKPASGNGWTVGAGRAANSVGPRSGGRPQSVATTHATGTTSEIRWLIFRVRVPRGTKLRRLPRNQTLRNRVTVLYDPAHPSDAMIDRPIWNWLPWAPIGAVGLFLILVAMRGWLADRRI